MPGCTGEERQREEGRFPSILPSPFRSSFLLPFLGTGGLCVVLCAVDKVRKREGSNTKEKKRKKRKNKNTHTHTLLRLPPSLTFCLFFFFCTRFFLEGGPTIIISLLPRRIHLVLLGPVYLSRHPQSWCRYSHRRACVCVCVCVYVRVCINQGEQRNSIHTDTHIHRLTS